MTSNSENTEAFLKHLKDDVKKQRKLYETLAIKKKESKLTQEELESFFDLYHFKIIDGPKLFWEASSQNCLMDLSRAIDDYSKATTSDKKDFVIQQVMQIFAKPRELPGDFENAKNNLLPRIREVSHYEIFELQHQIQDKEIVVIPHTPLTNHPHLEIELVWDQPESVVTVSSSQLKDWKLTFEEGLEIALNNLKERTPSLTAKDFKPVRPGLFMSPFQDNFDASRLLLPDFLSCLKLKGQPVVFVTNQDVMLAAGSEDATGLGHLADVASTCLEKVPQPLSGFPLKLCKAAKGKDARVGTTVRASLGLWQWTPYVPKNGPTHKADQALRAVIARHSAGQYHRQKELLDTLHRKRHPEQSEKLVAGTLTLLGNNKTHDFVSYCVWTKGVHSLLPSTDLVVFCDPKKMPDPVVAQVDWDIVLEKCPSLITPVEGMYPARWSVSESTFPSDNLLSEMQEASAKTAPEHIRSFNMTGKRS